MGQMRGSPYFWFPWSWVSRQLSILKEVYSCTNSWFNLRGLGATTESRTFQESVDDKEEIIDIIFSVKYLFFKENPVCVTCWQDGYYTLRTLTRASTLWFYSKLEYRSIEYWGRRLQIRRYCTHRWNWYTFPNRQLQKRALNYPSNRFLHLPAQLHLEKNLPLQFSNALVTLTVNRYQCMLA